MNVQTEFAPPPSPTLFKGEVIVGPPRPRIYVDQLVASSIKNPIVLHTVASQLKDNKAGNDILLPKENPLVRYVAERMETEIAQFGNTEMESAPLGFVGVIMVLTELYFGISLKSI